MMSVIFNDSMKHLAWQEKILTRGQIVDTFEVLLRAISLWSHVLACQPAAAPRISLQTQLSLSLAPPSRFIKINVDVTVVQGSQRVGIEVVARDEHGLVLETQILSVKGAFSGHVVELLAAREGMLLVSKHLWTRVILEFDASNVINYINFTYQYADCYLIHSSYWNEAH